MKIASSRVDVATVVMPSVVASTAMGTHREGSTLGDLCRAVVCPIGALDGPD